MGARIIGDGHIEYYFGTEPSYVFMVEGLGNIYEESTTEALPVDQSIAQFICDLNNNGFITCACCSALDEDHPEFDDSLYGRIGYLWFSDKNTDENKAIIQDFMAKTGFIIHQKFYKDSNRKFCLSYNIVGSNEHIKQCWESAKQLFSTKYEGTTTSQGCLEQAHPKAETDIN